MTHRLLVLLLLPPLFMGCSENSPANTPAQGLPVSGGLEPAAAPDPETLRRARLEELISNSLKPAARKGFPVEDAPHYVMDLDVDWDFQSYRATSRLTVTNRSMAPLGDLVFLLFPNSQDMVRGGAPNLVVESVTVDGEAITPEGPRDVTLRVPLRQPLAPGERATVEMAFKGRVVQLPDQASDLGKLALEQLMELVLGHSEPKGGYGVFSWGDGILSLALWYPILAVHGEGGWDLEAGGDVGDVSHFDVGHYEVTVRVPSGVTVVATGVEIRKEEDGGRVSIGFEAAAVREFAVQASERYETATLETRGTIIRSVYLQEDKGSGHVVLKQAARALETFTDLYGIYPYTELDIVEAPLVGGAGGVEFPGLVTVAQMFYGDSGTGTGTGTETGVGLDSLASHPLIQETREFVVAHEVAHEWWNATVGSDSKGHPFVDEAMANSSAIRYFHELHGPKAAEKQRDLQLRLNYQVAMMMGARDRPVDLPTSAFKDTFEYAAIVYGKGALFFEAMREHLGPEVYDRVLRTYYADHMFGIAGPDDLVDGFVGASSQPEATRALTRRWLHETHGKKDVGPIRIGRVLRQLLGEGAELPIADEILDLLDHDGFVEITRILSQGLSGDADGEEEPIDLGAIIGLLGEVAGANKGLGAEMDKLFKPLGDEPTGEPAVPPELLREIERELDRADPQARQLFDAMKEMFKGVE